MPERSRKVTNGGFDALPPPAAPRGSRTEPATIPEAPAEILTKPRPVYTAEARSLRIEGAVVLEILFRASGKVSVLRVLQGLGHGLDEAAIRAAEELVFRPALRDGRPVDSKSTVHVLFQLVY
jgi:TonB family protein